jgi:hypothetical protein
MCCASLCYPQLEQDRGLIQDSDKGAAQSATVALKEQFKRDWTRCLNKQDGLPELIAAKDGAMVINWMVGHG